MTGVRMCGGGGKGVGVSERLLELGSHSLNKSYFSELNLKTCTTKLRVALFLLTFLFFFKPEFELSFGNFLPLRCQHLLIFGYHFGCTKEKAMAIFFLHCLQCHVLT